MLFCPSVRLSVIHGLLTQKQKGIERPKFINAEVAAVSTHNDVGLYI